MTTHEPLGECPRCGATIPRAFLLIKYETDEGWPAMYAECPGCTAVVHPTGCIDTGETARNS